MVDPWLTSIPGGGASDAKDMMVAMSNVARIRDETKASVLIVHHDNRSGSYLGSMALDAICDTRLHLVAEEKLDDLGRRKIKATVEKQRDDGKGELSGHLVPVALGEDEDGDPVSSVVFVGDAVEPEPVQRLTSQAAVTTRLWDAIQRRHNPVLTDMDSPPAGVSEIEKDTAASGLEIGGTRAMRRRGLEWLRENKLVVPYDRVKRDRHGKRQHYKALRPVPFPGDGEGFSSHPAFAELEDVDWLDR